MLQGQLKSSPGSVLSIRFCAFMRELFYVRIWVWFPLCWKEIFCFLSREGDGWWSISRSKVGYWDDILPPPCKEKLSGVNGNESAELHHITQLLGEGKHVRRFYILSFSICLQHCTIYSIPLPLNITSKDIDLLHGKLTVIRPCIFKVSYCNILGCKSVLYFGTPFATQNRQVSSLTKRNSGVLFLWTFWPAPHMKLLISLVIKKRLRCKMASGQMLL